MTTFAFRYVSYLLYGNSPPSLTHHPRVKGGIASLLEDKAWQRSDESSDLSLLNRTAKAKFVLFFLQLLLK